MKIPLREMAKRAGRTRVAVFIARKIAPTKAQEGDLLRIYMRVVTEWGRAWQETVQPAYERELSRLLRDSVDDVGGTVDTAAGVINRLVVSLGANLEDWVVRVERWHRKQFSQTFTPVGVNIDTLLGSSDVAPTLQAVLADNVSLIRSLDDQVRNGISGSVFRGLANRTPVREIAREIRQTAAIAQSRAVLIASDQAQTLTARLDQERQEQVGLTRFRWAHSRKKHPRPEHVARDGKIFAWDSDVGKNDPPGRAIRCGCKARAVLDFES